MRSMVENLRISRSFAKDRATITNDVQQRELFEAMAIEWRRDRRAYEGLLVT